MDTKTRLLDAAEEIFSEHGFAAASMRAITGAAEVNLAAVNYHFGGKQALFRAVLERRIAPVNRERLDGLDALEADGAVPDAAAILEAFVAPALRRHAARDGCGDVLRLVGRMFSEPGDHWNEILGLFDEVFARFRRALRRALPDMAEDQLIWRLHFCAGVMCHAMSAGGALSLMSGGLCDGDNVEATLQSLIPFVAGGMESPMPAKMTSRPPATPSTTEKPE